MHRLILIGCFGGFGGILFTGCGDGDASPPTGPVTVNRAPQVTGPIPEQFLTVRGETTVVDIAPFFSDPDEDKLTFGAESSNAETVSASVSGSILTLTPLAAGKATITVTASDSSLSVSQTINVTVAAANKAPEAVDSIPAQRLTEGGIAVDVDVVSYFRDPDGDPLTYTAKSSNPEIVTVSISGTIATINPVTPGTATIAVTASDDSLTATQTIDVTVAAANKAPVAVGSIPAQMLAEGGPARVVNVVGYFREPDGDPLKYTATSSMPGVAVASISGSVVTLTPVSGGAAVVTVTARDRSSTARQTIDVTVQSGIFTGGICDRTVEVRDAIVKLVPGVFSCGAVTDTHLSEISTSLNLVFSGITSLRSGDFAGLTNLRILLLNRNKLTTLPAGVFSGLAKLNNLRLHSNDLQSIPANLFRDLDDLEYLDLEFNELTSLPSGLFSGLNLRFLGLEANRFEHVPAGWFTNLNVTLSLDLSHNQISSLGSRVFSNFGDLTFLDLSNNRIQSLPVGILKGLTSLKQLFLENNPGARFDFTMSVVRVSGTNKVVIEVSKGAPFNMTTTISATGGSLPSGVNSVTVPVGRTRSNEIEVTPLDGTTISLGTAPSVPRKYQGIKIKVSNPITF